VKRHLFRRFTAGFCFCVFVFLYSRGSRATLPPKSISLTVKAKTAIGGEHGFGDQARKSLGQVRLEGDLIAVRTPASPRATD
jgi:hypothetical protein